jgi:hypothetical protein
MSIVNAKFVYFNVYGGNVHGLERYSYVFTWTWVNYSCIVSVEVFLLHLIKLSDIYTHSGGLLWTRDWPVAETCT